MLHEKTKEVPFEFVSFNKSIKDYVNLIWDFMYVYVCIKIMFKNTFGL